MYKPGAIVKITVKNFVTYTYAEMFPGPNLNMLVGPNGTGKSTIVAAIILGLGGNPKTVGRGSKISEYVKHNCTDASIEIELKSENEGRNDTVTREFNVNQQNVWKVNGHRMPMKEVYEFIGKYNIQVDNLCQFLPQDRVQDFAKLNKQELLKQTQVALCKDDLTKKQEILIEKRGRHRKLIEVLKKQSQTLEELQNMNIRLEGKVTNFKKKKKYIENMKHIDRKAAWVNFEILQEKREEVKNDKNIATEVFEKHKNAAKPIETAITRAKKVIADQQGKLNESSNGVRRAEDMFQNKLEIVMQHKKAIKNIEGDKVMKLRELEQKQAEITSSTFKLENLAQNKQDFLSQMGSPEETNQKIKTYGAEIKVINNAIRSYEEKKVAVENVRREKTFEIRRLENDAQRIENVKQQRLDYLRRDNEHAYICTLWLRENKHLFKGEVFEPMMLELNVLNPNHAIYLENTIAKRDLVAFTCTLKEDMNLLVRILREQKNYQVNIVHSGGNDTYQSYQPTIPIEQLRQYGLFAYLSSLFIGPDPIMKYLCKNYAIHNIPVGSAATNQHYESIPRQVTIFFSDKFRFSSTYSQYTGAKSTSQSEIRSDGGLSISVDASRLDLIRGQIHEIQAASARDEEKINNFSLQVANLTERVSKLRNDLRAVQTSRQQIDQIESRMVSLRNRIEQMRRDTVTVESIQLEASNKMKGIFNRILSSSKDVKKAFLSYSDTIIQQELQRMTIDTTKHQVTFLENKAYDIRQQCQEAEGALNRIRQAYASVTKDAKTAFQKAKELSNGFTPDDEGFNEFRALFDKLSNDLNELEGEKEHMQTKIDCLNTADDGEMYEYENRVLTISKIQEKITAERNELDDITENLDRLKDEWLTPLNELIGQINDRFGAAFERMGCAGEITLCTGDNDKDFEQYGLSVKVTYRNGEPLQELNTVTQSGGERAVATATYMLSLQELTPVPFRCVDEINQGMDANNERRIFELLVDSTSQPDTSQYFIITPKLIPNLKFVPTMKIHFVHNGPFICEQHQWNNHRKH